VLLSPLGATAQTDAESERDRVRRARGETAADVDALRGDQADVEAALRELNDQVQSEEAALASAEREVDDAESAQLQAEDGIDAAEARLTDLEDRLRDQAVQAYTDPEGTDLTSVLDADSATDMVKRRAILDERAGEDDDLVDQVRLAQTELQAQRRAAAAAGRRAEAQRVEVQSRLDSVEDARDQQDDFAADVQERIDAGVARAISLGNRDRALSTQIAREQAILQAQLVELQRGEQRQRAREQAAREQAERERAEREQAEREQAEREQAERDRRARDRRARDRRARDAAARQDAIERGQDADAAAAAEAEAQAREDQEREDQEREDQEREDQAREDEEAETEVLDATLDDVPSGPTYTDGGAEPAPVAPPAVTPIGGGGGMCNAAGITVNCQIAEQVRAMIAAAAADGVSLTGGGYRDPSQQIALREQHCGSSYYAIYQMPSGQCRPPTAIPGSSQHELGLAVDFQSCGRSSSCFGWLSANASSFGMYNLPSEPWHWSVNGT